MPVQETYFSWLNRLRQLWPWERITRVRNMAWLIAGLWEAKSIHLSHVAVHLPWPIQKRSAERRLSRFVHNRAVHPLRWYEPVARQLVAKASATVGEVRLILDTMPVHAQIQVVIVSLAFRRRALPLAWTWLRHGKGHSSSVKQIALLARIRQWIPPQARVSVVGDNEFGSMALIQQLEAWGWTYVLRQKGSTLVGLPDGTWTALKTVVTTPGQSRWYQDVVLTDQYHHRCNLLAHWEPGEKEPWFLATSSPTRRQTLQAYRRRMWADEMHRDLKSQGFHLDKTHIRDWRVLSRLFLAVVLLYVWLIALGTRIIKHGQRYLVDHPHRRDLSVFRIGSDWVRRCWALRLSVGIFLLPYF